MHDPSGKPSMCMENGGGAFEGQWHAKYSRNDRMCQSYEAHVILADLGNVHRRPVLNLWAVVQYVAKYATKAPKGSRRVAEVLKDAVDEVWQYVPENEGSALLRRSIQKFCAKSLGEHEYHVYEAFTAVAVALGRSDDAHLLFEYKQCIVHQAVDRIDGAQERR